MDGEPLSGRRRDARSAFGGLAVAASPPRPPRGASALARPPPPGGSSLISFQRLWVSPIGGLPPSPLPPTLSNTRRPPQSQGRGGRNGHDAAGPPRRLVVPAAAGGNSPLAAPSPPPREMDSLLVPAARKGAGPPPRARARQSLGCHLFVPYGSATVGTDMGVSVGRPRDWQVVGALMTGKEPPPPRDWQPRVAAWQHSGPLAAAAALVFPSGGCRPRQPPPQTRGRLGLRLGRGN